MVVDKAFKEQLRIDINITFHALTCNDVRYCEFSFIIKCKS
jgi:hypothetical protein